MTLKPTFESRVRGCLLAVPIGDAMGMSVEAMTPKGIRALLGTAGITEFRERLGPDIVPTSGLKAGATTDDWQLTKAVARSLVRTRGVLSVTECVDEHLIEFDRTQIGWGGTTTRALLDIKEGRRDPLVDPLPEPEPQKGSGNGVMMKIAPVAIMSAIRSDSPERLWHDCRILGMLTHPDIRASITAFAVAYVMQRLLICGEIRDPLVLLREVRDEVRRIDDMEELDADRVSDRIDLIASRLGSAEDLRMITGFMRFHCMYTVTITLGTFLRHPTDFRSGILEVVNQGGDTDTNAAIVGAMIGALVGVEGIPSEWIAFNPEFSEAITIADQLLGFR